MTRYCLSYLLWYGSDDFKGDDPVKCPSCSGEIPEQSSFCNLCGYKIEEPGANMTETENNPNGIEDNEPLESHASQDEPTQTPPKNILNFIRKYRALTIVACFVLFIGIYNIVHYNNEPTTKISEYFIAGSYDQAHQVFMGIGNATPEQKELLKKFFTGQITESVSNYAKDKITLEKASDILDRINIYDLVPNNISAAKTRLAELKKSKNAYILGKQNIQNQKTTEGLDQLVLVDKEDNNYQDAQQIISKYFPDYKKDKIDKAEGLLASNKYDEALAEIIKLNKYASSDNEIVEEMKKIRLAKLRALIATSTTSTFDDMKQETIIVPPGFSTRYLNVSNNINIYPEITVTKENKASLYVWVGFQQRDWIFFQKVIFNADGEIFSWTVNFQDRHTQVLWGSISEWVGQVPASPEEIASLQKYGVDSSLLNADLINQMRKLANAKSSKIRFQGQGYRDHVVTDDEKANLNNFLDLYQLYCDLNMAS